MSAAARYQLAPINVARLRAPLDAPLLADFVAALAPINALADRSPGFVWRLQTEAGDATAVRLFADDLLLVNMSTWESLAALADYVYQSAHTAVMRRRRTWFAPFAGVYVVLWWVAAGQRPTPAEAETRLRLLEAHGPTPEAFTFRAPFPPPGSIAPLSARAGERCPA